VPDHPVRVLILLVTLALLMDGCLFNDALYEQRMEELPEECERPCSECDECEECVEHPRKSGCDECVGCGHCFETS
jgi:hypothetical protein